MDTNILLRIDEKVKEKITKIAEQDRRSVSNLINLLIDKKIAEAENGK